MGSLTSQGHPRSSQAQSPRRKGGWWRTSQPTSGPLTSGFFCVVRPEAWGHPMRGGGISPSLRIRSSSSRNMLSCY